MGYNQLSAEGQESFNTGALFMASQVIQNGGEHSKVISALEAAGYSLNDVENSSLEDYDKNYLIDMYHSKNMDE